MARAGFWVRGARGKFAGAVLQKGERGTVMRENVVPANPQTIRQMCQRVAFGTSASAAKYMLPVIGIAMEGFANKKVARREFVAMNSKLLRGIANNQVVGIYQPGAYMAKGIKQLIPNPYKMSLGSLKQPSQFIPVINEDTGLIEGRAIETAFTVGDVITAGDIWRRVFGIKPGQQLTRNAIFTLNGDNYCYYHDAEQQIRYSQFFSDRLVLTEDEGETVTLAADTTREELNDALMSIVDTQKSADTIINMFTGCLDITVTGTNINIAPIDADAYLLPSYGQSGEYKLQALGFFVSEWKDNIWCYSTSQLVCVDPYNTPAWKYGLSASAAIDTYLRGLSEYSDQYTQQGGDDDAINPDF